MWVCPWMFTSFPPVFTNAGCNGAPERLDMKCPAYEAAPDESGFCHARRGRSPIDGALFRSPTTSSSGGKFSAWCFRGYRKTLLRGPSRARLRSRPGLRPCYGVLKRDQAGTFSPPVAERLLERRVSSHSNSPTNSKVVSKACLSKVTRKYSKKPCRPKTSGASPSAKHMGMVIWMPNSATTRSTA